MNDQPSKQSLTDEQLLEKLVDRFTAQIRAGKKPNIKTYQDKYPHLQSEIHQLLSSVAMIEGLKTQQGSTNNALPGRNNEILDLERLGDYRIVRELGRGGMGIVLEAVHESLGRHVAIKVLPSRLIDDEKYVERFRREAQAAATLHHTNIVSVFGVGQSEGLHYYVMEFVDGYGLNQLIRSARNQLTRATKLDSGTSVTRTDTSAENREMPTQQTAVTAASPTRHMGVDAKTEQSEGNLRLASDDLVLENQQDNDDNIVILQPSDVESPIDQVPINSNRYRWAAELVLQIADALSYAHDHGKLHRDIKPANLLVDREGSVWLTDFGLVKNVGNQTMTKTGDIIGTPQYMAPESFSGNYDERSETFCLGLTLYEAVTLQPAFAEDPTPELIRKITSTDPIPPRRVDTKVPRDLDTIIQKATARDPRSRYQTAAQLRDDLRAYLENRPIEARRASAPERLWRWSQRNPWAAVSACLLVLVAVTASIGFIATSNALNELSIENTKLDKQKKQTDDALQLARQNAQTTKTQFQRAESNVQLAMDMFDSMFNEIVFRNPQQPFDSAFDGFQELSGIETAVTAREAEFLESMLVFYEKFAEQNAGSTELDLESAKAFRRVANIYHVIGKFDEAIAAYDHALKLMGDTARDGELSDARSVTLIVESARTNNELASALVRKGDFSAGMARFRKTRSTLQESGLRSEPAVQLELARTLNLLGSVRPVTNPNQIGITTDFFARRSRQNAGRGNGKRRNTGKKTARGGSGNSRQAAQNRGARDQSIVKQGLKILDQLIQDNESRPEYRLERAKGLGRLAELQYSEGDYTTASVSKRLATGELLPLLDAHPANPAYKYVLAQLYGMPTGNSNEVEKGSLEKALALVGELTEQSSRNLDYKQLEADVNMQLAKIERLAENKEAAILRLQVAFDALLFVVSETPMNVLLRYKMMFVSLELAKLKAGEQEFKQARDVLVSSLRAFRGSSKAGRRMPGNRRMLVQHYQLLGQVYSELGDDRRARQAEREARQLLTPSNLGEKPK